MSLPSDHFIKILFFSIIGLYLFPVWYFEFFPTSDGASHVGNSAVLRRLITGECSILSQFFYITPYPVPNWGSYLPLSILTYFFSPLLIDKKGFKKTISYFRNQ